MREIIFRGKHKYIDGKVGEWRYGSLSVTRDGHAFIIDHRADCIVEVEPSTVGQYTGLEDRTNVMRIYEGDILAYTILNKKYRCKVVWSGDSFRCVTENLPSQSLVEYLLINTDAKVIGNIYDKEG